MEGLHYIIYELKKTTQEEKNEYKRSKTIQSDGQSIV